MGMLWGINLLGASRRDCPHLKFSDERLVHFALKLRELNNIATYLMNCIIGKFRMRS